jgi:ParB family chromosome partitioning protein
MRDTSFIDELLPAAPVPAMPVFSETGKNPVDLGPWQYIPLDAITPDPDQPRKSMDEQGLRELADSILTHGVLQPILLEKLDDGGYRIIAGERRFRAACIARDRGEACLADGYVLDTIPARIHEKPLDETLRLEQQLVENLAREDMPEVEISQALHRLIQGRTKRADLAKRIGKSRQWVQRMLLIAEPEIVEKAERLGVGLQDLNGTLAERLAACGDAELDRLADTLDGPLTVAKIDAARAAVKAESEAESSEQAFGDTEAGGEEPVAQEPVEALADGETADEEPEFDAGTAGEAEPSFDEESSASETDSGGVPDSGFGGDADGDVAPDKPCLDEPTEGIEDTAVAPDEPTDVAVRIPHQLLERLFRRAGLPFSTEPADVLDALEAVLG